VSTSHPTSITSTPQPEPHHTQGSTVRVVVSTDGDTLPGVVTDWCSAEVRDYRVHVSGNGIAAGKYWRECAPECVLAGEA
jgi:hypothetical protein